MRLGGKNQNKAKLAGVWCKEQALQFMKLYSSYVAECIERSTHADLAELCMFGQEDDENGSRVLSVET